MSWREGQVKIYCRSPEVEGWEDGKFSLPLQIGFVWSGHRKIVSKYLCERVTPKPVPLFHFSLHLCSSVRRKEVILWRMGSRGNLGLRTPVWGCGTKNEGFA